MCEINEEHVLDELAEIAFATPWRGGAACRSRWPTSCGRWRCCTSIWVLATARKDEGWSLWMSKERRKEKRGGAGVKIRLKEKIPAVFWPVHQAIRRGEVTEVVAKGGRGSGKSSYLRWSW